MDDLAARKIAKFIGLTPVGTLGTFIIAKKYGIIKTVRPLIEGLISKGNYYSEELVSNVLKLSEEN